MKPIENQIEIYQSSDGHTKVEVKFEQDNIWLNQKQLAHLFDKDGDTIGLHFKNIFNEGELEEESTTEEFSVVQKEGKRNVRRKIKFYNLDSIISMGATIWDAISFTLPSPLWHICGASAVVDMHYVFGESDGRIQVARCRMFFKSVKATILLNAKNIRFLAA